MGSLRARSVCATLLAAAVVLGARAQSPEQSSLHIENIGLAAVEESLAIRSETHGAGSAQELQRAARAAAEPMARIGGGGRSYTAGRVLIRFNDSVAPAARRAAARQASPSAELDLQPSYADFDVVRIDPSEDAELVAEALRERPDVQYAQAAYRVHPTFVPNDPFYRELQWNLPLVNLE